MSHAQPSPSRLDRLAVSLGRRRRNRYVRRAAGLARTFVETFDARSLHNIDTNGERAVLERFGGAVEVALDVGANVGDWSATALACGVRSIHAFEISPTTATILEERFAGDGRVRVNRFGLSDDEGEITIRHFPDHPKLTTVTAFPHDAPSVEITVPVRRGDDYLTEAGVDCVDLLKMDVEGAEHTVLHGFRQAFEQERIGAVQFEYGLVAVFTKFLVTDFYELLGSWGFRLGPIRPDGVHLQDYSLDLEMFRDANFLAVHRSRTDLLGRLGHAGV